MDLEQVKHYSCPMDQEEATLLVDLETETMPETDDEGNLQYYCLSGQHVFCVDEDGKTLI